MNKNGGLKNWIRSWRIFTRALPVEGAWVWFDEHTKKPVLMTTEFGSEVDPPGIPDRALVPIFMPSDQRLTLLELQSRIEQRLEDWRTDEKEEQEKMRLLLESGTLRNIKKIGEFIREARK